MPARKVTPNAAGRLTVTLDAGDKAELDRLSKDADRSLAWVVREAIREYLERARAKARGKAG
jgi:predicted transcriptional regulator